MMDDGCNHVIAHGQTRHEGGIEIVNYLIKLRFVVFDREKFERS